MLNGANSLKVSPESFGEASSLRDALSSSIQRSPADVNKIAATLGGSKVAAPKVSLVAMAQNESVGEPLINHNMFTEPEYFGGSGDLLRHPKIFDESETVWHAGDLSSALQFREVLQLTKVVLRSDVSVGAGKNIKAWRSFNKFKTQQSNPTTLIALTDTEIVLVREKNQRFQPLKAIDLKSEILCIESFKQWRDGISSQSWVIIVSTATEIVWFETKNDLADIDEVWRWQVHKPVMFMKHLHNKETDLLILTGDQVPYSADIYEFNFKEKQFWIAQVLPVKVQINSIAVIKSEPLAICIGQEDEVLVFRYEPGTLERGRLVQGQSFDAPGLHTVISFGSSGVAYLAIAANEPKIYSYHSGEFEVHEILGLQISNAKHMIPIQVQTHRDDFLLLIQHDIVLESHVSTVVRALIWNGVDFEVAPTIPCIDDGEEDTKGLSCLLDHADPETFEGSTFIQNENSLSLIVPQREEASLVYDIFYKIAPATDPIIEELKQLENFYEVLAKTVEHQDSILENALKAIQNAFTNTNETNIETPWAFDSLSTPAVFQKDEVKWERAFLGAKEWTANDEKVDLSALDKYLPQVERNLDVIASIVQERRNQREVERPEPRFAQSQQTRTYYHAGDSPRYNIPFPANGRPRLKPQPTDFQENYHRRPRRDAATSVTYDTLQVQDLVVENINGIPASELVFSDESQVELKRLVFKSALKVLKDVDLVNDGKVNGIDLDKDLIHFTKPVEIGHQLHFERLAARKGIQAAEINHEKTDVKARAAAEEPKTLEVNKLIVKGDLTSATVNGQDWKALLKQFTFRHRPNHFESLRVKGVSISLSLSRLATAFSSTFF